MPYYIGRTPGFDGVRWGTSSRDEWIKAVREARIRPKPPEWWLATQEREEGRDRTQASIIWVSRYKPERKALIWDLAPDDDFVRLGYIVG